MMALKLTSLLNVFTGEMITITVTAVSRHSAHTIGDFCPFLAQIFHGSIMTVMVRQTNEEIFEIPTE
jgi:hypothetical protein